ncbi:5601_t:CDS:2, partial [Acaulospora colombiana]
MPVLHLPSITPIFEQQQAPCSHRETGQQSNVYKVSSRDSFTQPTSLEDVSYFVYTQTINPEETMENSNSTTPSHNNEGLSLPTPPTSPPPPYSNPGSSMELGNELYWKFILLSLTMSLGHARGVVATMGKVDCKDVSVEVHGLQVTAVEVVEEHAEMSFKDGQLVAFAEDNHRAGSEGGTSYLLREQGHARGIIVRKGTLKMEGTKVYAKGRSVTGADAFSKNADMTLKRIEIKGIAVVDSSLSAPWVSKEDAFDSFVSDDLGSNQSSLYGKSTSLSHASTPRVEKSKYPWYFCIERESKSNRAAL